MINTENAQKAILTAIEEACHINLSVDVKNLSEALGTLVNAEIQDKMSNYALTHCPECQDHLDEGDFPQEIN